MSTQIDLPERSSPAKLRSVDGIPQILSLDDAETLLRGHVGLLCGPPLSRPDASFGSIAAAAAAQFNSPTPRDYLRTGQDIVRSGVKPDDLRSALRAFVSKATPFSGIKRV